MRLLPTMIERIFYQLLTVSDCSVQLLVNQHVIFTALIALNALLMVWHHGCACGANI
jgi:hypothetical protein